MPYEEAYQIDIGTTVEMFIGWMSHFENQHHFHSVQQAYKNWLVNEGFALFGDDYAVAVAVILVFLSRCIANPINRRYLSNPPDEPDEFTVLQVHAPEEGDDVTYWEFLTEANFHAMYRDWQASRSAQ